MTSTASVRPAAGPGKRIAAYAVDLLVVAACAGASWALRPSPVLAGIVVAEVVLVLSVSLAATGRTPGLLATCTAMTASESSLAPGLRRGLVHCLVALVAHLGVVVPALAALLVTDGRTWIDRAAGTRVVDLAKEEAPTEIAVPASPYSHRSDAAPRPRSIAHDGFGVVGSAPARPTAPEPVPPSAPVAAAAPAAPAGPVEATAPVSTKPEGVAAPSPAPSSPSAVDPLARPAALGAPAATRARVFAVMDSGEREPIDATIVIGRAPSAADPGQRLVAIADSTRSLSRTHLRIGPTRSGVWVEDAFSANGTSARLPDGRVLELPRGERRSVPPGTTLLMGERTLVLAAQSPDAG